MNIYEYWAVLINSIDETEESVSGVVMGNNFAEAMKNIESYYEEELIGIQIRETEFNECSLYEFQEEK